MKILSINAGSSSLKFQLYQMPEEQVLIASTFERIGLEKSFYSIKINGEKKEIEKEIETHEKAVTIFLNELINYKIIEKFEEINAVGHRVVHGGDKYSESCIIDEEVKKDISIFSTLAPLHNPANLIGIDVINKLLPNAKNIAVFDTAFHQTMKQEQYIYPVPYEWYTKYGVRKYGFHGTSHKYLAKKATELLNNKNLKIITCHLGNGASITAIKNQKSIANSLGFTPLSGVMMGTRSGDIDPSIIPFIMKQKNKNIDEIMNDLNKKSGCLGVSGISSDSRDIKEMIDKNHERSILTHNMYVEKIVSYIANYYVLLEGADLIVFAGGIGEKASHTRKAIIEKLKCLDIYLDEKSNEIIGKTQKISSDDSKVLCYVIPTDEELMIAKDTYELIK